MSNDGEVRCASGHGGPWRYVEAIEVWREVLDTPGNALRVESRWQTGEGFNEGIEGSAYLMCCAPAEAGFCAERVEVPEDIEIDWIF